MKGTYDTEIANSLSFYDFQHAFQKAMHVVTALHVLSDATKSNIAITWKQSRDESARRNVHQVTRNNISMWYIDMTLLGEDIGKLTSSL